MSKEHTLRVRPKRWEAIKDKAWELSKKEDKYIKPTDIADALLSIGVESITLEMIEEAKKTRD